MEVFNDLMKKITQITAEGPTAKKTLDILKMAAYFAPTTNIRIGLFSPIISNRSELRTAISLLRRRSLVQCPKENTFLVPEDIGALLRRYIDCGGVSVKEGILINAIETLLCDFMGRLSDYPHCVSLYTHAKGYPRVLQQLGELPGVIVLCMLRAGKSQEAVEFGKESDEHLTKILGEHHRIVLYLECSLGLALNAVEKREEAIKLLTAAYGKACRFGHVPEVETAMHALETVICCDPLTVKRDEVRLRSIVFPGSSVSASNSDLELKKCVDYAAILHMLDLNAEALSILDRVTRTVMYDGEDDPRVFAAMEVKALVLAASSNKHLDAMELLKQVYEKKRKIFGPLNKATLDTKSVIGKVLFLNGNLEEAMTLFADVVSNIKQINRESIELYANGMKGMIEICIQKEDLLKALQLSSDLHDKLASDYGDIHPKWFDCRKRKSDIFLKLGQPEKALEVLKRLLEDYEYDLDEVLLESLSSEMQRIENIRSFDAPPGTLHSFAKYGNTEKVLSLIEGGENIDSKDSKGRTPLHYASAFGQIKVARAFIGKGAKTPSKVPLEVAKGSEMMSLLRAVQSFFDAVKANDSNNIVGIASKEPCVLGARDDQGCTCLHWAALRGYGGVFRLLLELGSDPTAVSVKGNSPLHIAASKGHSMIAETLLRFLGGPKEVTAALDGRTSTGGNTPLHAAAEKGHVDTVRSLLGHGAVCGEKNAAGKTPLQVSEDLDCRNLLGLVEGLFVDSSNGNLASVCAKLRDLESGDVFAVSRARNGDHRTLLQEAMKQKNLVLAKKLVKLLNYNS